MASVVCLEPTGSVREWQKMWFGCMHYYAYATVSSGGGSIARERNDCTLSSAMPHVLSQGVKKGYPTLFMFFKIEKRRKRKEKREKRAS